MSLLDLSLLGLLADQPLHGYELSKRLRDLGDGRGSVSFGSLYPALGRLDKQGLVTVTESDAMAARSPMTGSLGAEVARLRTTATTTGSRGRRNRKVYLITDDGRARLRALLEAPADDDRTFAAQLAFCRHLDQAHRLSLLQRRRRELAERLAAEPPRLRDRYRLALRDRDRLATEAEIAWLEHLIDEEQHLASATSLPSTTGEEAGPPPTHVPDPAVGGSPR
jgi:DNA-binding PadR family transcriptional regulator